MIEPFAALGLAGNIVQFVQFSCELLCESKEIYESASGASTNHVILEEITKDLNLLNDQLTAPAAPGAIPDSLIGLASCCKDITEDLLELLSSIKVKGPHKKWNSLIQASRSVWKKEQIEALVRQAERLRSEMQLRLQFMMTEQQSEFRQVLLGLLDENRRLQMNTVGELEILVQGVNQAIYQIRPEAKILNTTVQEASNAI
ncbi:MAG: hypothetical protein Q9160_004014 [Pyrenula sp. 1 TL-2023]